MAKTRVKEEIKNEEIKTMAYFLWEKAGSPWGQEMDFWLEAEKVLNRKHGRRKTIEINCGDNI